MRRFLTTIVCVLCVLAAYAVSYGTSYKGSGYTGRIYTTSSARTTSIGSGGAVASAPMATMSSTSLYNGRGIASNVSQITGIRTSASGIVGGVTTFKTEGDSGGGSGDPTPYNPGQCDCDWQDNGSAMECSKCHTIISYEDYLNEHFHGGGDCPCHVPIGDGWEVWLFMAAMAFVYAAIKKRHSHQTETVPSRPGCE